MYYKSEYLWLFLTSHNTIYNKFNLNIGFLFSLQVSRSRNYSFESKSILVEFWYHASGDQLYSIVLLKIS